MTWSSMSWDSGIVHHHRFVPREGGVKVVFDVPTDLTDHIARVVGDAGFDVHRYYEPEDEHRPGGSPSGQIRLGAERPWHTFTDAEQGEIVAAFEAARVAHALPCAVVGVDSWDAGGPDGPSGVREPRRPLPVAQAASATADVPAQELDSVPKASSSSGA